MAPKHLVKPTRTRCQNTGKTSRSNTLRGRQKPQPSSSTIASQVRRLLACLVNRPTTRAAWTVWVRARCLRHTRAVVMNGVLETARGGVRFERPTHNNGEGTAMHRMSPEQSRAGRSPRSALDDHSRFEGRPALRTHEVVWLGPGSPGLLMVQWPRLRELRPTMEATDSPLSLRRSVRIANCENISRCREASPR